jgi:hypothetical protein
VYMDVCTKQYIEKNDTSRIVRGRRHFTCFISRSNSLFSVLVFFNEVGGAASNYAYYGYLRLLSRLKPMVGQCCCA